MNLQEMFHFIHQFRKHICNSGMIECMGIIGIKVKFDFKALFSKPRSKVSALQISHKKIA